MDVITGSDKGILPFVTIICPNAKGAVFAGPTSSADSMAVAIENVRCPIVLDSPFAKGSFEVFEGGEGVALLYDRHFDRADAKAVDVASEVCGGWHQVRRLQSRAGLPGTESAGKPKDDTLNPETAQTRRLYHLNAYTAKVRETCSSVPHRSIVVGKSQNARQDCQPYRSSTFLTSSRNKFGGVTAIDPPFPMSLFHYPLA